MGWGMAVPIPGTQQPAHDIPSGPKLHLVAIKQLGPLLERVGPVGLR